MCAEVFFLSLIYVLNLYGDVLYVSESFDENDKKKVLNLIPTMCMFGPDHWVTVWISS